MRRGGGRVMSKPGEGFNRGMRDEGETQEALRRRVILQAALSGSVWHLLVLLSFRFLFQSQLD